MKKILLLLMSVLTFSVIANAADGDRFSYYGLEYEVLSEADKTLSVTACLASEVENIVIPASISIDGIDYSVVEIGDNAFDGHPLLESITIPDSVIKIGKYAFYWCIRLTSVTIPDSVVEIGDHAFYWCISLTSIKLPEYLTVISDYTFAHSNLASVIIPNSVKVIGEGTFSFCADLTNIEIPDSVTKIGENAFSNCYSLESISISDSVEEIGSYAFYFCYGLKSVVLPKSMRKINKKTFAFSNLISVTIPNSVTVIGERAFDYCSNLSSAIIPDSVTEIGDHAFHGCYGLTSLTIPESVTILGGYAFDGCDGLTTISIPKSLTVIGNSPFGRCDNVKTIYAYSSIPQDIFFPGSYEDEGVYKKAVVYVPKGSVDAYRHNWHWYRVFNDFREMGIVEISLDKDNISIENGESESITANVTVGEDVTIESESWVSSNPDVATVKDGFITAVAEGDAIITYSVTDNYGETHTASCKVLVSDMAGVIVVDDDLNIPTEYYNMNGVRVDSEQLIPGIYIKCQGDKKTKILVK